MMHTPGPWEKKHSKRLGWAVVYPGISLLAKAGAIVVVCDTMNEEDATLIAAAPDMAARIERLETEKAAIAEIADHLKTILDGTPYSGRMDNIRWDAFKIASIAKATQS